MAKGGSGSGRSGGGGGVNPANIKNEGDLIAERDLFTSETGSVMKVSRYMADEYNDTVTQFLLADVVGKDSNTLAYYDGANIGFNRKYYSDKSMERAYKDCVDAGFHPSNGNKTAMEAVAAHEYGHALTNFVAQRIGEKNLHTAADRIVKEARKEQGKHRGVVQMARKISGYATASNAEAVAEAVADCYCNGSKAKAESRAIVNVVNKYLKR